MFYSEKNSNTNDITKFFQQDDFYNSSILLKLKDVSKFDFETSNLLREDLVAYHAYGNLQNIGTMLLNAGETQTLTKSTNEYGVVDYTITDLIEPFDSVNLFDRDDLDFIQNKSVQENELTEIDINKERRPDSYKLYITDNKFYIKSPIISPASGKVTSGTTVTMSCGTDNFDIYYTTDGTNPTTQSKKYGTSTLSITKDTIVKAISFDGTRISEVVTNSYSI